MYTIQRTKTQPGNSRFSIQKNREIAKDGQYHQGKGDSHLCSTYHVIGTLLSILTVTLMHRHYYSKLTECQGRLVSVMMCDPPSQTLVSGITGRGARFHIWQGD